MTAQTIAQLINQLAQGSMTARESEDKDGTVFVDLHMPTRLGAWMRTNIAPRALYLFCETYSDGATLYVIDGKFVLFTPRY